MDFSVDSSLDFLWDYPSIFAVDFCRGCPREFVRGFFREFFCGFFREFFNIVSRHGVFHSVFHGGFPRWNIEADFELSFLKI